MVEYEAKDYKGNIDYVNSYKIKETYLDSYITRTLPDGMEVTYYMIVMRRIMLVIMGKVFLKNIHI